MKIDSENLVHSADLSVTAQWSTIDRVSQNLSFTHVTAPSFRRVDDPFGSKHGLTILTHKSYATAPSHEDEWFY